MSTRREVRSLDIGSVVRVTFVLMLCLCAIVLVGLVALYLVGLVSGGLGGVEGFVTSLGFSESSFRFSILPFVLVFVVLSALGSAVMALLAAIVALLYNHVQPIVGGVVVRSHER